ncbi:VWA domain-containing protein [Pontibacter sp. G13]|uniref:VWA domain-containing protein n=1 Tax=Pontibacter sp. G13 TaxID=3074898 RepID=UPI00288B94EA|nr:VWA domain-containing protein [Pontibacter sp. G13]WNJ16906.1 VWA domain-containing protein [Pontibacter sp. G13]
MQFAFPEYWTWLLGIPVTIAILYLVFRRVTYITESWFSPDQYSRSHPFLKFGMRTAGFSLLFIALLGPYLNRKQESVSLVGREIFILLDVSASMNAQDVRPSRLEKAKEELGHLINHLKGDKIGLILFTEHAYLQCPLTQDYEALSLFLEMAGTYQFAQTGTQFRSAMVMAMDRFRHSETDQTLPDSRAIILVSDGEDFGDTYASLIGRLNQARIKVFPVGVGTAEGARVPRYEQGKQQGFMRREDGSVARSVLKDEDLKNLAVAFNTPYYKLDRSDQTLGELEERLYALTASPVETRILQVNNNLYQGVLLMAILLLFASMTLMPTRKL